ncbi:serine carboxypeptidase-like 50 [Amborella trichopoda]|nr:serine carboxypeptidase-like 50 [Amborella trichopoda]|eukprot:XP_006841130.2 serine carboxypeptidase-like 50 [Amborella trichopoda]
MTMEQSFKLFLLLLIHILPLRSLCSPVPPNFPPNALPTKSGYLPINPTTGSAMFYAFYEATRPTTPLPTTPLLVWLQGGPGCSSMIGNLFELGPWRFSDGSFELNPGAWNHLFGLLFLDSPIGTGFSVAPQEEEIPNNQTKVARHLHIALTSFLLSNPPFISRPLYITGESYAGKYVPAAAFYILQENKAGQKTKLNLRGVAIGDGLTHPEVQVQVHADTAYFMGLMNRRQKAHLEELQRAAVRLVREQRWADATTMRNEVLDWLQNATGLATLYDLRRQRTYETEPVGEFLRQEKVAKALGVKEGVVWEECSGLVGGRLHEDVMKSVRWMLEAVVREIRVFLYTGEFDLRDGVSGTVAWLEGMEWEGLQGWMAAERDVWVVGKEVAGYIQTWSNLTQVVVRGAGHLVPADQAVNSQAMIQDWVLQTESFGGSGRKQRTKFKGSRGRKQRTKFKGSH